MINLVNYYYKILDCVKPYQKVINNIIVHAISVCLYFDLKSFEISELLSFPLLHYQVWQTEKFQCHSRIYRLKICNFSHSLYISM
jgi:hypothetical protein